MSVISPTNTSFNRTSFEGYWNKWYNGASYAAIVISDIDRVTDWVSEEERNAYLAEAYFHQAYFYYRLVNQFGDVPVYLSQIEGPRTDFSSYSREAILKMMRDHMEYAVQWLPNDAPDGQVNRAAGYHLLTKLYLQLRQFENAIDAASQVIDGSGYALMQERFGNGRYPDDPRLNVMWDLFEKENIGVGSGNTEGLYVTQDFFNVQGSVGRTGWMRVLSPRWFTMSGFIDSGALVDTAGRGSGFARASPYYVDEIRDDREDDYRRDESNWFAKEEYYFNDEDWLRANGFEDLIGKPATEERLERVGSRRGVTIPREWYTWQYNKLYVPDEEEPDAPDGGHTPWYIFRLAGTYLLRAEAYWWNGQPGPAAADLNAVRERSNADPVSAGEVDIDYIFEERARELWWEEPRKTEMTRVSYIMAQLGRGGYNMSNMAETNWWYDRSIAKNDYFGENRTVRGATEATYNLVPGFIYWPVPQDEIDSNTDGTINQWRAYTGSENNIEPKGYEAIRHPGRMPTRIWGLSMNNFHAHTRRDFLKTLGLGAASLAVARGGPPRRQPNILFIEHCSMDALRMGAMGDPVAHTPNLDRLASQGVLFRNAYCNSPQCCPSRASMWSGQHVHEIEAWNNYEGLTPETPTFQTHLKQAGYQTAGQGKIDYLDGRHSIRARVFAWTRAADIRLPQKTRPIPTIENSNKKWAHPFDWESADWCANWLEQHAGNGERPFFLYCGVPASAPHPPLMDMAELPKPEKLSGQSLMPLLTGDAADRRDGVLSQYHSNMANTGTFMLRHGPWKYVAYVMMLDFLIR